MSSTASNTAGRSAIDHTHGNHAAKLTVRSSDRLTFTLFLAIAAHCVIILGVGFTAHESRSRTQSLEVTLAQYNDEKTPEEADFLAQHNQQGSGELDEARETTSTQVSHVKDNVVQDLASLPHAIAEPVESVSATPAVATTVPRQWRLVDEPEPKQQRPEQTMPSILPILDIEQQLATLEARLAAQRQLYAKRPRVRRLTSVTTKSAADAYYLASWRRKVESIGNLNYPAEARRKHLYGSLRMLVTITPDGALQDVKLLESSGHAVLDDAALRIVRLAAPFAPFPEAMRKDTDILEIIRTWSFQRNAYTSS